MTFPGCRGERARQGARAAAYFHDRIRFADACEGDDVFQKIRVGNEILSELLFKGKTVFA